MKKTIIFLALFLTASISTYAQNTTLDKIENSLYGYTYSNEQDENRVNRIEENVYGKKSNGQLQNRIAKLKKDLIADQIGQEITPKEDTFMEEDDFILAEKEPAEAQNMDYPVINELEKQVFKQEHKNENIKSRLSKLEQKTFNKTYEKDDLSTRVDRLKAKIKPQSFMANGMDQQDNSFYHSQPSKMAQNYHLNQYGNPYDFDLYNNNSNTYSYDDEDDYNYIPQSHTNSRPLNLSTIEKKLYKTKYENQPTSERLTRIESSVFGTSFPNDSDSERIERLSSAIQAQKSARRYDSNKFGQNMATAFQIGTLILMVLACIL